MRGKHRKKLGEKYTFWEYRSERIEQFLLNPLFTGMISPDHGFNFGIYKTKSVFSLGPLIAPNFYYFVVPETWKKLF
jgi:hypothetical protein